MRLSATGRMVLATGLLAALTSSCGVPAERPITATSEGIPATTAVTPAAQQVRPDPAVGAVFLGDAWLHTCSAAVLKSASGDLILTAAHCLADGIDATFVAGFNEDAADEDVWHVDDVYLDQRWVRSQEPQADFAIARVSRDGGGSVQSQAGGGLAIGRAPKPGAVVTVTGYELGVGGGPISCTAAITNEGGFPSLACLGLIAGLSGAPWVDGSSVTGLIGGLHGGGCDESVSYSPPFDDAVIGLLARAEAGGPGDDAPTAFDDDCD